MCALYLVFCCICLKYYYYIFGNLFVYVWYIFSCVDSSMIWKITDKLTDSLSDT